jgi:hypothetical protein
MKARVQILKRVGVALCCAIGLHAVPFVYRFDIFSSPVRSWDGWLGPLVRGDSQAIDIGSVWHTDTPNLSLYRAYQPFCWVWLRVQGLSLGS